MRKPFKDKKYVSDRLKKIKSLYDLYKILIGVLKKYIVVKYLNFLKWSEEILIGVFYKIMKSKEKI
jgi:hypothetical protein